MSLTSYDPGASSLHRAIDAALQSVRDEPQYPVPLHLRNAPTAWAKGQGHGDGYLYAHDCEGGVASMRCLPEEVHDRQYYQRSNRGFEKRIADRMAQADELRESNSDSS